MNKWALFALLLIPISSLYSKPFDSLKVQSEVDAYISSLRESPTFYNYWALIQIYESKIPGITSVVEGKLEHCQDEICSTLGKRLSDTITSKQEYEKLRIDPSFKALFFYDLIRSPLFNRSNFLNTNQSSFAFDSQELELIKKIEAGKTITYDDVHGISANLLFLLVQIYRKVEMSEQMSNLPLLQLSQYNAYSENRSNPLIDATRFKTAYNAIQDLKAVEIYEKTKFIESLPTSWIKQRFYLYLSFSLRALGRKDEALPYETEWRLPFARLVGDSALVGSSLYRIAMSENSRSESARILRALIKEESYQINAKLKSEIYDNLAYNYRKLGRSEDLLATVLANLKHEKKSGLSSVRTYRRLSEYYYDKGNFRKAFEQLKIAKRELKSDSSPDLKADVYGDLIQYYLFKFPEPDSARHYLDLKKKSTIKSKTFKDRLDYLFDEAIYHRAIGDKIGAKKYFLEYLNTCELNGSTGYGYHRVHMIIAFIHLNHGEVDSAKHYFKTFERFDQRRWDFKTGMEGDIFRLRIEMLEGKNDKAIARAQKMINRLYQLGYTTSDAESGLWQNTHNYFSVFNKYIRLLLENRSYEEALVAIEQLKTINDAKNRTLNNSLVLENALSEQAYRRYHTLKNRIVELRNSYIKATGEERLESRQALERVVAQKMELEKRAKKVVKPEKQDIKAVQSHLSNSQMVIHAASLKDYFYVSTVTNKQVSVKRYAADDSLFQSHNTAIQSLANGTPHLMQLYELSKFFKLDTLPEEITEVIVAADGRYLKLPFDVLPLTLSENPYGYGSATYMVDRYTITNIASLSDIYTQPLEANPVYRSNVSAFGISAFDSTTTLSSLPFARKEAETVANIFGNSANTSSFLNEDATEEHFRAQAPQSRILHLATHSSVSNRNPLYSTIQLSHPGHDNLDHENDGVIYAYELYNMDLNNQLVFLNSCESGAGPSIKGAGILGFSRALRGAGVQNTILNLWSLNDQKGYDFATAFYNALNEGHTIAEANRMAKLDMIRTGSANPHFWGSHVVYGQAGLRFNNENTTRRWIALMLIGVALAGFAWWRVTPGSDR